MILKSCRREVLCPTVIVLVVLTIFPTSADPIPVTSTPKSAEFTTPEPESISTTSFSVNTSLTTTTSTSTTTTTTSKPPPPKRIINVSDAPVGISVASPEEVEQLPKSFDGRAVWSHCPSLRHVSDQGSCGGCWAVVTTDVAADRLCIASNGTIKTRLSPMHLLQCCGRGDCNDGIVDFGACAGGDPWGTWRYFAEHGVVSARCKPYPRWVKWMGIATFEEGNLDGPEEEEAARCRKQCAGNSSLDFEEELYFGRDYYRLPVDEGTIRKEIFENGPVVTHISINDPEMDTHRHDGSVIYRCPKSVGMATHGVRLIGWGEEKKDPAASAEDGRYWLAVNSWSRSWGNNGTFRIARGSNSCHVEEFVSTLLVKV